MHIASFYWWMCGVVPLEERLGMSWWIKLCREVNGSLNTAHCFHYMWGNEPLVPGKKRDIIQFPVYPLSLLLKPDGYLLGGRWVAPPLAKTFSSVCGGEGCRGSSDFSLWPLFAAGKRQHLSTSHKAAWNSPLSSGLRTLRMERATAALPLQLPGHRPPFSRLFASIPHLPGMWYGLWETAGMGLAWLGGLILGRVMRLLYIKRECDHSASVLVYFMTLCSLSFVFWMCCAKPQKVHVILVMLSTLLSEQLNLK